MVPVNNPGEPYQYGYISSAAASWTLPADKYRQLQQLIGSRIEIDVIVATEQTCERILGTSPINHSDTGFPLKYSSLCGVPLEVYPNEDAASCRYIQLFAEQKKVFYLG